eukprot:TRINITY_DN5168_c0_g1_i1.p1 TRINITY_DN5168_c0_g1~~TRINITY_DN5168_c0_g1_i1.p1  ORF type:complete len:345 (-),score=49.14 TRINITY_DN5168_c0_g1_i1:90-1124(-)
MEYVSATTLLEKLQGCVDDEDEFDSLEEIDQSEDVYDDDYDEDYEVQRQTKKSRTEQEEEKYDVFLTYCKKREFVPAIKNVDCPICYETVAKGVCLPYCNHSYCYSCFQEYLASQIGDRSKLRHNIVVVHQFSPVEVELDLIHFGVKCPDPNCRCVLTPAQVKSAATHAHAESFNRLIKTMELEENNPGFDYCPSCGGLCTTVVIDKTFSYQKCLVCNVGHCRDCKGPMHPTKTCKQANHVYKRHIRAMKLAAVPRHLRPLFAEPNFIEMAFNDWMRKTLSVLSRCPHCDTMIEKNGGCPNMFCTRCNKGFNWIEAQRKPLNIAKGMSPALRNLYEKWLNYKKK